MKYPVIFQRTPTSAGAYVPDLPGCVAVGKNKTEAHRLIREAIGFHLEGLREDKLPIPKPSAQAVLVEAS